jgi:hypothetical protein
MCRSAIECRIILEAFYFKTLILASLLLLLEHLSIHFSKREGYHCSYLVDYVLTLHIMCVQKHKSIVWLVESNTKTYCYS